jgi:hypothetical protein
LLTIFSALKESNRLIALSHQLQNQAYQLQREAEHHIEDAAISQCRDLCDTMQAVLPRELRDMVYGYLLIDETKCGHTKKLEDEHSSIFHVPRRPDMYVPTTFEQYPHVRDEYYVGIETMTELAEAWYRSAQFTFDYRAKIRQLFEQEPWGLDLDVRQLIRNVHVHIWPSYYPDDVVRPGTDHFFFVEDIHLLSELRKPAIVTIRLDVKNWAYQPFQDDQVKYYIEGIAEFLFPVLRKLLEGEVKVLVQVAEKASIEIKGEDLEKLDRWYQVVQKGHKLMIPEDDARRATAKRLGLSGYYSD